MRKRIHNAAVGEYALYEPFGVGVGLKMIALRFVGDMEICAIIHILSL